MESTFHARAPSAAVVPCGAGCAYAEVMTASGGDWIWCHRPEADVRLVRAGRECPNFVAYSLATAPLPGTTATA